MSKLEIFVEIKDFYDHFYVAHAPCPLRDDRDHRASLRCHYMEDLLDIDQGDIVLALRQIKHGKAPGEDGFTSELLKAGGAPIIQELQSPFNTVLYCERSPKALSGNLVVLFFKKGD